MKSTCFVFTLKRKKQVLAQNSGKIDIWSFFRSTKATIYITTAVADWFRQRTPSHIYTQNMPVGPRGGGRSRARCRTWPAGGNRQKRTWRCNILCSKHDIDMRMNEWNRHALFLRWNGRNRYLHSSLLKIWDFFHSWEKFNIFPLVLLVPLRSTREKMEFLTLVEEIPDLQ
jgi:hypothetical protein